MRNDAIQDVRLDRKGRVRKPFSPMYLLGNLLIVGGLLMLLGIGGWYGYTWYSTEQQRQQFVEKFGSDAIEPPVAAQVADAATPTVVVKPTTPPPALRLNNQPAAAEPANVTPVQDNSPPVRLVIPSVKIDQKVVPVTWEMIPTKNGVNKSEWQVADYAVGHHFGSANPGQIGNVVLSGHVDYKGEVFRDLHNVSKGDEVVVYTEKGQYLYVVTDLKIVKEEGVSEEQRARNAMFMNPTPDQTLTMITCWPYGIDDHRLIVIAKPYQSSLSAQGEYFIR
jgi:sortase A